MGDWLPQNWTNVTLKGKKRIENDQEGSSEKKRKRKTTNTASQSKSTAANADTRPHMLLPTPDSSSVSKKSIQDDNDSKCISSTKEMGLNVIESCAAKPCDTGRLDTILKNVSLNLQNIVHMTSFKRLLKGCETKNLIYTNEVFPVSKKYEDSFLRQAIHAGERSCVRGEHCECNFIDPTLPFVGVEFVLPWESTQSKRNGLCLPCLRAATQLLFFELMQSSEKIEGVIQRFWNKHSEPGEYDLSVMLVCPPSGPLQNLPMPIVRHQRNHYRVYRTGSIVYMDQVGVDFRPAPCP